MKAGAVLSLVLAIVLGLWAAADFYQNVNHQARWRGMLFGAGSGTAVAEIQRDDDLERQDGLAAIMAWVALIGSVVMFSQSKKAAMK
jgi:uncharacterized membrane protein